MDQSFTWLPLPIREALRKGGESGDVFLVGGAVRDIILGQKCRDYDFVLGGKIKAHCPPGCGSTLAGIFTLWMKIAR